MTFSKLLGLSTKKAYLSLSITALLYNPVVYAMPQGSYSAATSMPTSSIAPTSMNSYDKTYEPAYTEPPEAPSHTTEAPAYEQPASTPRYSDVPTSVMDATTVQTSAWEKTAVESSTMETATDTPMPTFSLGDIEESSLICANINDKAGVLDYIKSFSGTFLNKRLDAAYEDEPGADQDEKASRPERKRRSSEPMSEEVQKPSGPNLTEVVKFKMNMMKKGGSYLIEKTGCYQVGCIGDYGVLKLCNFHKNNQHTNYGCSDIDQALSQMLDSLRFEWVDEYHISESIMMPFKSRSVCGDGKGRKVERPLPLGMPKVGQQGEKPASTGIVTTYKRYTTPDSTDSMNAILYNTVEGWGVAIDGTMGMVCDPKNNHVAPVSAEG